VRIGGTVALVRVLTSIATESFMVQGSPS
jgi:hypothetical protein